MKIKLTDITENRLTEEQTESLQKYFKSGGTWQELLQLKEEEIEEVYAIGYNQYNEADYEKALTTFSALIQLNPYELKHWLGIGATLQGQENYGDAFAAYQVVLSIDGENLQGLFYSAQCAYAMGQEKEAIEFLENMIRVSDQKNEQTPLTQKAKQILQMMKNL